MYVISFAVAGAGTAAAGFGDTECNPEAWGNVIDFEANCCRWTMRMMERFEWIWGIWINFLLDGGGRSPQLLIVTDDTLTNSVFGGGETDRIRSRHT